MHFINWRQQPEFRLHMEKLTADMPKFYIKQFYIKVKACESLHKKTQPTRNPLIPEQETISQKDHVKISF